MLSHLSVKIAAILKALAFVTAGAALMPAWGQSASISGPKSVCPNTTQFYSFQTSSSTLCSVDWTFSTPSGTQFFPNVPSNQIIAVSFPSSGQVGVLAIGNMCCHPLHSPCPPISANFSIDVGLLGPLTAVSGSAQVCPNFSQTFSVSHLPQAVSYTWQVPSGWKINGVTATSRTLSGSAGASVSITPAAGASSGTIRVRANDNGCGQTPWREKVLSVVATPPPKPLLSGNGIFCDNRSSTFYAYNATTALYYEWEVVGTTHGATWVYNSFRFHGSWGHGSYTLRVRAVNACGASSWASRTVTVKPDWQCSSGGGPCHPCKVNNLTGGLRDTSGLLGKSWDDLRRFMAEKGNYLSLIQQKTPVIGELFWDGELPGIALVVLLSGDGIGDILAIEMQPGESKELPLPVGAQDFLVAAMMPFQVLLQDSESLLSTALENESLGDRAAKWAEVQEPEAALELLEVHTADGLPLAIAIDRDGTAHFPVFGVMAGKWDVFGDRLDPIKD